MGKDLAETFLEGEVVFSGNLVKLHRDRVRLPDGGEAVREYLRHPGAVVVLALLDNGHVVLERQFRYPHGREFVELPAGKRDPGEAPAATARRELQEETGYVAKEWRRLGVMHNAIAYSDEAIELWLARGLELRTQKLEPGEFLQVFTLPLAEARDMVRDGRITDAKSVVGLLWSRDLPGAD